MNTTTTRLALLWTFLLAGLLFSSRLEAQSQNGSWNWVSGSQTPNPTPSWGQKGVPDTANHPGEISSQTAWTDASGNVWLFGGEYFVGTVPHLTNDLWMYNPTMSTWTWESGDSTPDQRGVYGTRRQASPTNKPGSRFGQVGWKDGFGNFWMFGGFGYDADNSLGMLNDLWEYIPGANQWMLVNGDTLINNPGVYGFQNVTTVANEPPARYFSASWTDAAGIFWLFGGAMSTNSGSPSAPLTDLFNDLWMYDPSNNQWTWVSGNNTTNNVGVYGNKGAVDPGNMPGGRFAASGWADKAGNFFIFGGRTLSTNYFNDTWKFTKSSGEWTWIRGANVLDKKGIYGTMGVPAPANTPGARVSQTSWTDVAGNAWIFGGRGYDSAGNVGLMNDMWEFTSGLNEWIYQSGSPVRNSPGNYGTQGVTSTTNNPPGMAASAGWSDASGNMWLFSSDSGTNDLWEFTPTNVLALNDVQLQGAPQGQGNLLTWQTIGELNTAKFVVERSTNGTEFADVGSVTAVGKGDNDYSYDDAALPAGVGSFWYRLKMMDEDSSSSWSSTIVVHDNDASGEAMLYPNPAHNEATLQLAANSNLLNTPVRLVDVKGNIVREYLITSQQQLIDLTNIPQGVYFLELSYGKTLRLIRN